MGKRTGTRKVAAVNPPARRGAHHALRGHLSRGDGAAGGAPPLAAATVLDAAALGKLRELDPQGQSQLLERVFTAFESSLLKMLPQLVAAERSGDWPTVRHVAHTLKSSSATVGALELSRLCAEIEALSRASDDRGMAERVDDLLAESAAVRLALQAIREGRA